VAIFCDRWRGWLRIYLFTRERRIENLLSNVYSEDHFFMSHQAAGIADSGRDQMRVSQFAEKLMTCLKYQGEMYEGEANWLCVDMLETIIQSMVRDEKQQELALYFCREAR